MDEISDTELVKRLKDEFNYKCGPITVTTRNVYLRKLEKFIEEKNGKDSTSKSRRRTIAAPLAVNIDEMHDASINTGIRHSPRNRRSVGVIQTTNSKNDLNIKNVTEINAKSPRRKTIANDFKEMSNISPAGNKNSKRSTLGSVNQSLAAYSSAESSGDEDQFGANESMSSNLNSSKNFQYPKGNTNLPSDSSMPSARRRFFQSNKVPSPHVHSKPLKQNTSPFRSLNSIRLPNSSNLNLANFSDSETEGDNQTSDDNIKTITDHLMKYRPVLSRSRYSTRNSNKQSLLNGKNSYDDDDYSNYSKSNEKLISQNELQANSSSSTSNWIPLTIISLLCFFFVVIISLYLYSCITFQLFGKDMNLIYNLGEDFNIHTINKTFCKEDSPNEPKCLQQEQLESVLINSKRLHDVVKENLINHLCETPFSNKKVRSNPYEYSLDEVRYIIKSNLVGEDMKKYSEQIAFLKFVNDIFNLIELNPNWHMKITEKFEVHTDILDKLALSFSCRLYRIAVKFFAFLVSCLIVIIPGLIVYAFISHRNRQQREEKELVFDYIDKVIELLQSPENCTSAVPIIHVRDMLFSLQELQSKKLKNVWLKVVKYIEDNESRVKVGLEKIHGEDFQTWRWIGIIKSSKNSDNDNTGNDTDDGSSSTVMKTGTIEWQGQAFFGDEVRNKMSTKSSLRNIKTKEDNSVENQSLNDVNKESLENKINENTGGNSSDTKNFTAPTSFLKVRNIFNGEQQNTENWKENIGNAIIEKCLTASTDNKHGILHISVDDKNLSEGVVYVKCDSINSATKAFYALHGWWCERKLVSVRFLKEERYYLRFPEARSMNKPLTRFS